MLLPRSSYVFVGEWDGPFTFFITRCGHSNKRSCNGPDPLLADIVLFELSLSDFSQGFKTRLLREGFHTLTKGVLFSSNQCGTSQSIPFGAERPRWHSFLSPIDVRHPPNPPHLGPASLLAHRLMSTPLQGTARRLTRCLVFSSDTICNGPDPQWVDIVLFGVSLSNFPQDFKTRLLGKVSTPL